MFDALKHLRALTNPREWIMDHQLRFGTAAACLLAVPVGLSIFYANGYDAGRLWTASPPAKEEVRAPEKDDSGASETGSAPLSSTSEAGEPERLADMKAVQSEVDGDANLPSAESGELNAAPPVAVRTRDESRGGSAGTVAETAPAPVTGLGRMQSLPAPSPEAAGLTRQSTKRAIVSKGASNLAVRDAEALLRPAEPQAPVSVGQPADPRFQSVQTNPLRIVAEHPVSTFSIDVDTASYAQVRRMLNQGILPAPGDVRVEELINYFSYDYPAPDGLDTPFQPSVAVYPTPWNPNTKLLHIGIKGADIVPTARPRANLVFLIDTSGSMHGRDRLPLLQTAFRLLVQELDADDTVSIVTYAGNAGTVLEPTKASNRRAILEAIDTLRAGGSTAGASGIRQAYALAERSFDKQGVNRVILATDGDFNVGMTDPDQLKNYISEKRKSGVFLSVLGFGQGNYQDGLMQVLAQNGNGVAAYIDSLKEAEKVLVTEAASTLFPIAKDVKIQIEFNPAAVAAYRLIGYETRMLQRQDFNNDKIDAGDIGSGHTVTALYEITPVGGAAQPVDALRYQKAEASKSAADDSEYGFLKLRYKKPDGADSRLMELPIGVAQEQSSADSLSDDMRFAAAVAAFGQKLRGAADLEAMSFARIQDLAASARGADRFGFRAEFIDLVRMAKLLTPMAFESEGKTRE